MKTLTKSNLAVSAAVLGGAALITAFWLTQPAHAELADTTKSSSCGSERLDDKASLHPGIDLKLLVHRPDLAPNALRLEI